MPPPGSLVFDYNSGVPVILSLLTSAVTKLRGDQVEGMFRVAALKDDVDWIRDEIKGGDYRSVMVGGLEGYDGPVVKDPIVAGDLLKSWLRALKTPLFPTDLYDRCVNAGRSGNSVQALGILPDLEPANRACVEHLCGFLAVLSRSAKKTKMTASNLALVFAPNLLKSPSDDPKVFAMHAESEKRFITLLIEAQGGGT